MEEENQNNNYVCYILLCYLAQAPADIKVTMIIVFTIIGLPSLDGQIASRQFESPVRMDDRCATIEGKHSRSTNTPAILKKLRSTPLQEDVIEEVEREKASPPIERATLHFMRKYLFANLECHSYFDLLVIDINQRTMVSFDNLIEACSTEINLRPCILIEGESGCGKTTLLRQMAFDWARKTSTSKQTNFCAVLLYDVYVEFTSKANNLERQLQEDNKLFSGSSANRSDILILLDVFWYIPIFALEKCREYFRNATVVFTAHPDLVKDYKYKQIQSITHYFKILGYKPDAINNVIEASLHQNESQISSFQNWIAHHPFAHALIHRPLYCCMLTYLSLENCLPSNLANTTKLVELYIMHKIGKEVRHPITFYSDLKGDDSVLFKSIVDLSSYLPKINQPATSLSLPESFGLLRKIEFPNHQVITFVNSSIMAYFMALFCTVSPNKPSHVPMEWPLLWLYLGGMNQLQIVQDIISTIIQSKHQRNIFSYGAVSRFECKILGHIMFELQSVISQANDFFQNSMMTDCNPEADPVGLYTLGWRCATSLGLNRHYCSAQKVCFDIPYVSEVAKYVAFFSNGTSHSAVYPTGKKRDFHIDISGNAVNCIDILANSKFQTCMETLRLSGDVNFKSPQEVIEHYLDGLGTLDITGSLTSECNQIFSILPNLKNLHTLVLRYNGTVETNIQCPEISFTPKLCNLTIDGFSPEFLRSRLNETKILSIIIRNCVISVKLMGDLIERVKRDCLSSITLEGEGIVSTAIASEIVKRLNSSRNTHSKQETYKSLTIKDKNILSTNLFQIASAVTRFTDFHLYIPKKYSCDFQNFSCIHYLDHY